MGVTKRLLKGAVHHTNPLHPRGVSERLFTQWFKGFFYNQIWEDARVDMEALQIGPESEILTISSAGCNVMNYLTGNPKRIVAVDLNLNHIHLTRLKLTAARYVPAYEDFFRFFGCADSPANIQTYYNHIRPHLDEDARRFWEHHTSIRRRLLGPRIAYFRKGLYNHARLGYFFRFLHLMSRLTGHDSRKLLTAKTQEEQVALYEKLVAPLFTNRLVRSVGNFPFFLFGIGIPPAQIHHLRRETGGDIMEMYRQRVRKLVCGHPLDDNHFLWQAAARHYDCENRKALPEYLQAAHFDTVKQNAPCVETDNCTVIDRLSRMPDGSLDRFVFLDSQDWMKPAQIVAQWREIVRVGRPGSRIIFRTASSVPVVEDALPADLRAHFTYEEALSRLLHEKDRSAIYGGFHLYLLNPKDS